MILRRKYKYVIKETNSQVPFKYEVAVFLDGVYVGRDFADSITGAKFLARGVVRRSKRKDLPTEFPIVGFFRA